MNFLFDILTIVFNGLSKLSYTGIIVTFILATVLSVGCLVLCNYYSHLWNKSFKKTATHNILSILAAVLTFFFVLAFASFTFFKEVADIMILKWQAEINLNKEWNNATFKKSYQAVKVCCENIEPFQNPKFRSGELVPLTTTQAQEVYAQTYADEGCKNFDNTHSLLSKIIWSNPEMPQGDLKKDTQDYFQKVGRTYPAERGIELVATKVKEELNKQTPRVVALSRIILVVLFFVAQAIPFGLIGIAAYNSLKVKV